jgi:hypothetical protein
VAAHGVLNLFHFSDDDRVPTPTGASF